eukprot:7239630-Alexandrium_andersonii.AAC.1
MCPHRPRSERSPTRTSAEPDSNQSSCPFQVPAVGSATIGAHVPPPAAVRASTDAHRCGAEVIDVVGGPVGGALGVGLLPVP